MAHLLAKLKALILDFDGTLATAHYDFGAMREAVHALATKYGVRARDLEGLYVLEAVERAVELIGDPARAQAFRAQAQDMILDLERRGASEARLLPGVKEALAGLRDRGFRLAVVTRNSRAATDLIPGLCDLPYNAFLTRESVRRVKPHPEHLLAALVALQCTPAQAAVVGDHPMDMAAGKAVGVATIGVLTGAGTRETLHAAGADLIVQSVAELAPLLIGAACDSRGCL